MKWIRLILTSIFIFITTQLFGMNYQYHVNRVVLQVTEVGKGMDYPNGSVNYIGKIFRNSCISDKAIKTNYVKYGYHTRDKVVPGQNIVLLVERISLDHQIPEGSMVVIREMILEISNGNILKGYFCVDSRTDLKEKPLVLSDSRFKLDTNVLSSDNFSELCKIGLTFYNQYENSDLIKFIGEVHISEYTETY